MQNHEVNGVQAQKKDGIDGIHAKKGPQMGRRSFWRAGIKTKERCQMADESATGLFFDSLL